MQARALLAAQALYDQATLTVLYFLMAGVAANEESFMLENSICGHYVYKRVWTPVNGQLLQVQAETGMCMIPPPHT